MSKKAKIIPVTLIFVLLVAVMGYAQRPFGDNQSNPNSFQGGPKFYHQWNPEQVAEFNAKKMQLALDLNRDEYDKAFSISLKFSNEMKESLKKIKTEPGNPSPETMYRMRLKKIELLQDVKQELRLFLTQEQIETWTLIMMKP